MDANGLPNEPAVYAAMAKLLLNSINQQPADSSVPAAVNSGTQYIPVKLTAAKASKGEIEFTLAPLNDSQRAAMLEKVRGHTACKVRRRAKTMRGLTTETRRQHSGRAGNSGRPCPSRLIIFSHR